MILKPRQQNAARLIAYGQTQKQAADGVGVHENTICVWMKIPAFREEIQRQHQTLLRELRAKLLNSVDPAITALVELCNQSGDQPSRLGAAKAILNQARLVPCQASTGIEMALGEPLPLEDLSPTATDILGDLEDYLANGDPESTEFTYFLSKAGELNPETAHRLMTEEEALSLATIHFAMWRQASIDELDEYDSDDEPGEYDT